jgi:agmatine deiminase
MFSVKPSPAKTTNPGIGHASMSLIVAGIFSSAVPQHIAELRGLPLFSPGIIMEGGALDVNGAGTVLTTESCLLNPNRNPTLNQSEIGLYLKDYLGVEKIIWLGDGIVGDDTDGHVDDLARFINPTTIVTIVEEDI